MKPQLHVIAYHYVRESESAGIRAFRPTELSDQLDRLSSRFEMASFDAAMAFLEGRYQPESDLCLLTFDDGLKEHHDIVWPMLAARRVQAIFALTLEALDGRVCAAHKGHLVMGALGEARYAETVVHAVRDRKSEVVTPAMHREACRTYRWDRPITAAAKYLLNFVLSAQARDAILDPLFARHVGNEREIARGFYLSWNEARAMQTGGMLIGGHSATHTALARIAADQMRQEVGACATRLRRELGPQDWWPFVYPYGSFDGSCARLLREYGFQCAFTVQPGSNAPADDLYALRRFDANDVGMALLGDASESRADRAAANLVASNSWADEGDTVL